MPAKIDKKKRLEMYAVYGISQSVHDVCVACGVDSRTVQKYRKLDGWDKKLDKLFRASLSKIDLELGDVVFKQLRALTTMGAIGLRTWMAKIKANGETLDCTINELLGILRLQHSLLPASNQSPVDGNDEDISQVANEVQAGLDLLKDHSGDFIRNIGRALARRGTEKDIAATKPLPRKRQRGKGADTRSPRHKKGQKDSN